MHIPCMCRVASKYVMYFVRVCCFRLAWSDNYAVSCVERCDNACCSNENFAGQTFTIHFKLVCNQPQDLAVAECYLVTYVFIPTLLFTASLTSCAPL